MANGNSMERAAPEFRIRCGGADLPEEAATDIKSVIVQEDLGAASVFTFDMVNWDMNQLRMKWSDGDLFAEGKVVDILMGYRDNLEKILTGEITALGLRIVPRETPALQVRGHDRRHRLLRGRNTHSFVKMKDSDIAGRIASGAGLTPEVEDTGVMLDYVLQRNQTDLEFLESRAARIGFEVFVQDTKLIFRKPKNTQTEVLTLNREMDLIEFYPRLTTMTQVPEISLRGWSVKDKDKIVSKSSVGDETTTMGGSNSGPKLSRQAFGNRTSTVIDRPVFSQAEADQIATANFNTMAMTYIAGDGVCVGRTNLRAGTVIKIEGLGQRFSGLYYVVSTTHTYTPARGYRTAFTARRNAT